MAPIERTERMTFRMSEGEVSMLRALADEQGLTAADVVRLLVRDAYKAKFGDKVPRSKK